MPDVPTGPDATDPRGSPLREALEHVARRALVHVGPEEVQRWLDARHHDDPRLLARKVLLLVEALDYGEVVNEAASLRTYITDLSADARPPPAAGIEHSLMSALRGMFSAEDPEEVLDALLDAVRQLGGRTVRVRDAGPSAIPINLVVGIGEPLLAVPDPSRPGAAELLQAHLPHLVEDARHAIDRLERRAGIAWNAQTDAMTGLPDQRAYGRLISRIGENCTLILIDLDGFRTANELHGRLMGDQILRTFAAVLRGRTRIGEAVIRLGADEFLVVLRDADHLAATRVVQRVRRAWVRRRPVAISFSTGIAPVTGRAGAALEAADRSLRLKRLGALHFPKGGC